jgi:hypothetical protein
MDKFGLDNITSTLSQVTMYDIKSMYNQVCVLAVVYVERCYMLA